jgi:CPA1 family monovalent cation:H+ antiporter
MTATSAVEFLIWLLIAASFIALLAKRLRVPYSVSLVLGGLLLGAIRLPILSPLQQGSPAHWLTPDLILILFLPALIFEGSIKIDLSDLRRDIVPLLLLAIPGVLMAALVTGYAVHWALGLPILFALVFGAIISATDPISVLAIFKDMNVPKRLALIVEAESLLNDGTAVVLFEILLVGVVAGTLSPLRGAFQFLMAVLGGAAIGVASGFLVSKLTSRIDDPQVEITFTTILAYGCYLLAHHLNFSGVIAAVAAGLMVGNFGAKTGMSERTRMALQSFWEYVAFVINSLVFLLIGLEVRIGVLAHSWRIILIAIGAVLVGRIASVYILVPTSNLMSERIPFRWEHIAVWGGLRGSLALAMALSLGVSLPYRDEILVLTFGVVVFSILVQGLTIKPLVRGLQIVGDRVKNP